MSELSYRFSRRQKTAFTHGIEGIHRAIEHVVIYPVYASAKLVYFTRSVSLFYLHCY